MGTTEGWPGSPADNWVLRAERGDVTQGETTPTVPCAGCRGRYPFSFHPHSRPRRQVSLPHFSHVPSLPAWGRAHTGRPESMLCSPPVCRGDGASARGARLCRPRAPSQRGPDLRPGADAAGRLMCGACGQSGAVWAACPPPGSSRQNAGAALSWSSPFPGPTS